MASYHASLTNYKNDLSSRICKVNYTIEEDNSVSDMNDSEIENVESHAMISKNRSGIGKC